MSMDIVTGLVGYWPFDDGSGSSYTKDLSPYSNTGELNYISDPNWVSGISGYGLHLDGSQECINCGDDSSLDVSNEVTVSAWIKLDDLVSGYQTIVGKWTSVSGERCYIFQVNDAKLEVWYSVDGDDSPHITSTINLTTAWTHVAFTLCSDDTIRMYINAVQDATTASLTAFNQHIQNTYVGKYHGGEFFDGVIDEVRIYNRGLNASEMNYLYKNPSGTSLSLSSASLMITDLNGDIHAITEDIENVSVSSSLSYASDTFNCEVANHDDINDFIEFGCEIEIYLGMGGYNTKRLTGIITEAVYTLDSGLMNGRIEISGEDIGYRLNNIYVFVIIEEEKEISDILEIVLETVDVTTGKSYLELADIDNDYTYIETSDYTSEKTIFAWTPLTTVIKELAEYAGFEWYIDVDRKLHFFDQYDTSVSATIVDTDLCSNPRISIYEKTINRGVVLAGIMDKVDQTGVTKDGTVAVTTAYTKTTSFTPTNNLLYSVLIWTELVSPYDSDIILKILDSDSNIVSGGTKSVYKSDIEDGDYTRFVFESYVYLIVGKNYTLSVEGTSTTGVNVGLGEEPPHRIAYITNHPVRVSSIQNDMDSYDRHGLYMDVYVDEHIIDPVFAAGKAYSMLNGDPKQMANVAVHDDSIIPGDVVTLALTTPGIKINKTMKVMNSVLTLKQPFIENKLELKEE